MHGVSPAVFGDRAGERPYLAGPAGNAVIRDRFRL